MSNQLLRLTGCSVLPPREDSEQLESRNRTADENQDRETKPKMTENRRSSADRFSILNNFVDFTMHRLSRNEVAVWFVLYRDSRDGIARTSQADIARRAGVTDRTVRNMIRRLERRGLLKTVFRGGLNSGPSRYRVIPLDPERMT